MTDFVSDGLDVVISSFKEGALNLDSFLRNRISQPHMEFEFTSYYDLLFSSLIQKFSKTQASDATIAHTPSERGYTLSSGTTNGSLAVAQQVNYNKYQPGRSQLILTSFKFGSRVTNTYKRLGVFDANDGIYLEQTGTTESICIRTSITGGSSQSIPKSSWYPEAQVIDFTKTQILSIDYQHLGVGIVRVGFYVGSTFILAYQFNNANVNTTQYMASGSLPLRYEIGNSDASSGSSMVFYCGVVIAEGGAGLTDNKFGTIYGARNITGKSVSSTEIPILAIRPKSTYLGADNSSTVIPLELKTQNESRLGSISIYYNPTLTNASWVSAGSESATEYDISATSFSGGRLIHTFIADVEGSNGYDFLNQEYLTKRIDGSQDVLLITANVFQGSATVRSAISWKEVYR